MRLMHRGVIAALITLVVVTPLAVAAGAAIAGAMLRARQDQRPPCPELTTTTRPAEIHLAPGLTEHQNWLDFKVPTQFAGTYALCFDGHQMDAGSGVLDFHTGLARFNIQTRLVDLYWMSRALDQLADAGRWELRLACVPNVACG